MPRWSEVAVARELLWPPCRKTEWARLQGALAVDAHDCIMVRIPKGSTEYKVVARRPRYDLAGSPQIVCRKQPLRRQAHSWHGRIIGSARAFAVNPARLKARPLRARGLTAQRGQATAPPQMDR